MGPEFCGLHCKNINARFRLNHSITRTSKSVANCRNVTLSDSNRNCEARTTVTLGKPPWRGLGSSTGATHSYYQIVLQSSIATLRAYDGNFTDIGTPTFSYPSATEVEIDVPIADMGLSQDKLSLGFASSWCGNPDYCDQYPNYWGYPYTGWSPSLWFDLSWRGFSLGGCLPRVP